jgi:hypothetical protein
LQARTICGHFAEYSASIALSYRISKIGAILRGENGVNLLKCFVLGESRFARGAYTLKVVYRHSESFAYLFALWVGGVEWWPYPRFWITHEGRCSGLHSLADDGESRFSSCSCKSLTSRDCAYIGDVHRKRLVIHREK